MAMPPNLQAWMNAIGYKNREDLQRLLDLVRPALEHESSGKAGVTGVLGFFERFGRQVIGTAGDAYQMLVFTGQLIIALGRTLGNPRRLRMTPLVAFMQLFGLLFVIAFVMARSTAEDIERGPGDGFPGLGRARNARNEIGVDCTRNKHVSHGSSCF